MLQDDTIKSYWHCINNDTPDLKMMINDAFQHACNTFFNFVSAEGCRIMAGDYLLHFMYFNIQQKETIPHFLQTIIASKIN